MRIVRPFNPDTLSPGAVTDWLLKLDEDCGIGIRVCRGSGEETVAAATQSERFALILEGTAMLVTPDFRQSAETGALVFMPAGKRATVHGSKDCLWAEIEAPLAQAKRSGTANPCVIPVDPSKFEGGGFAYQALADRKMGSETLRMNVLQVAPGAGSPDFHIHDFAQIYLIQEGEMTLDVGRKRMIAPANSIVVLPAGLVHRNFNVSGAVERHVSFLVPEPMEGEIFDYAITIHAKEAELLTRLPA
jgi:mannose-6-phosphate isomerase-like protein (cupin superfamily)